jgi:hypothetical protein
VSAPEPDAVTEEGGTGHDAACASAQRIKEKRLPTDAGSLETMPKDELS